MSDNHCFIIAEIGVNHNGSIALAKQLIDVAVEAGADSAKFQTFRADDLVVKGAETVDYQKRSASSDQYEMLKSLELSDADHRELVSYCNERGVEFMSTGFDVASLTMLIEMGINRIKIASGEITNTPLVEASAAAKMPIIVSTGMATLDEVRTCVVTIRAVWEELDHEGDLTVLHCTSAYPTPLEEVNLAAMQTMATQLDVAVGYSDHTEGILVAPLAVAAGARVIEKHVTLDHTMEGPDHAASIEPDELASMIAQIRRITTIFGDGAKAPRDIEAQARSLVRKGLKFATGLPAGHVLTEDDLIPLRPETGLPPARLKSLVGRTLSKRVNAYAPVSEEDL